MTDSTPIGIDLGTTFSCIAYWDPKRNEHKIIPNAEGQNTTASIVAFTQPKGKGQKAEKLVGLTAFNQASRNPKNTIYDAKRLIGREFTDPEVKRDMDIWPFKVQAGKNNRPVIIA